MDPRPILGLQQVRAPLLDDLSAAEARGRARACRGARRLACSRAGRRARVVGHDMSHGYVLEHPVDDPDEDEDDDFDEDDDGEDDDDEDEEDPETWQVSGMRPFR